MGLCYLLKKLPNKFGGYIINPYICSINNQNNKTMAKKTWKIGERCKGGVITTQTTKTKAIVIAKNWDMSQGTNRGSSQANAKEWDRLEVNLSDSNARRKLDNYLFDLTTTYHTDLILKWFESKVEFAPSYW